MKNTTVFWKHITSCHILNNLFKIPIQLTVKYISTNTRSSRVDLRLPIWIYCMINQNELLDNTNTITHKDIRFFFSFRLSVERTWNYRSWICAHTFFISIPASLVFSTLLSDPSALHVNLLKHVSVPLIFQVYYISHVRNALYNVLLPSFAFNPHKFSNKFEISHFISWILDLSHF